MYFESEPFPMIHIENEHDTSRCHLVARIMFSLLLEIINVKKNSPFIGVQLSKVPLPTCAGSHDHPRSNFQIESASMNFNVFISVKIGMAKVGMGDIFLRLSRMDTTTYDDSLDTCYV